MTNRDKLDDFYAALKTGLPVGAFLEQLKEIYPFIHSHGMTCSYQRGSGKKMKKLRDEITPVARFLIHNAASYDRVQFNLDNNFPDCVLYRKDGGKDEVEVTLGDERAQKLMGRASSTNEIVSHVESGLERRARRKKHHQADILLIEVFLRLLPDSRWNQYRPLLSEKVKALKFREVYLTGPGDEGDICPKIK